MEYPKIRKRSKTDNLMLSEAANKTKERENALKRTESVPVIRSLIKSSSSTFASPKESKGFLKAIKTKTYCEGERKKPILVQATNSKNLVVLETKSSICEDYMPLKLKTGTSKSGAKITPPAKKYAPKKTSSVPVTTPIMPRSSSKTGNKITSDSNKIIPPPGDNSKEGKVLFGNDGTILLQVPSSKNPLKGSSSKTSASNGRGGYPKLSCNKSKAKLTSLVAKYGFPKKTESIIISSKAKRKMLEKNKSVLLNIVNAKNRMANKEISRTIKVDESGTSKTKISESSEDGPTSKYLPKPYEVTPPPEYSEEFMSGELAEKIRDKFYAGKVNAEYLNKKLSKEGKDAKRILRLQLKVMEDERDELVYDVPYRFKCQRAALVRDVLRLRGWVEEPINGRNWDIHWSELGWLPKYFGSPGIRLKAHQKILHFRNCIEMTRKNLLVKNLRNLKHRIKVAIGIDAANELDFMPRTFLLPLEHLAFIKLLREEIGSHWIIKPSGGAQGKDIIIINSEESYNDWRAEHDDRYQRFLQRNEANDKILRRSKMPSHSSIVAAEIIEDIFDKATRPKKRRRRRKTGIMPSEKFVVQRYVERPLLICGRKFDIRFYVLVTSFSPLKAYMYREGFCRMSLGVYSLDDIDSEFTHLTNIAIQKKAEVYDDKLAKWPVEKFMLWIDCKYGESQKVKIANGIDFIVVKTLQSVEVMVHQDHHCFECYGFDVIFDKDLKPWLLEVNASPSFIPSNKEDFHLKVRLVDDTISVLNVDKRLHGTERRVGGYDLFWDSGPVYAEVDEDKLRETSVGKLPRLNSHLGTSNSDRVRQLIKIFDANRADWPPKTLDAELQKLVGDYFGDGDLDSMKAKIELDKFYRKKGYKYPNTFKHTYAEKTSQNDN